MGKQRKLNVVFRVWLFAGEEKLLGKGRVELLERIKKTGSITNAAKEMKMSYRQAWQMVEEMNERAETPLVEKRLGGKSGGGTYVTDAGEKAINVFHKLVDDVSEFINEKAKNIKL